MMKELAIIAACAGIAVTLGWFLWPTLAVGSLAFVEKQGEEAGRAACDRIVSIGPRVIPAIIASLKQNGPWSRSYCYLPVALRELASLHTKPYCAPSTPSPTHRHGPS